MVALVRMRTCTVLFAVAIIGAPSFAQSASPQAEASARARYQVVLKERSALGDLVRLERLLIERYGASRPSRLTTGALMGLTVELDHQQVADVRRQSGVASIVLVAPSSSLTPGTGETPADKIVRTAPGRNVPGLYQVVLHDTFAFADDARGTGKTWQVPGRMERDSARAARVLEIAKELISKHGGKLDGSYVPVDASFPCAMTERQARQMAADPRVRVIAESPYLEFT